MEAITCGNVSRSFARMMQLFKRSPFGEDSPALQSLPISARTVFRSLTFLLRLAYRSHPLTALLAAV